MEKKKKRSRDKIKQMKAEKQQRDSNSKVRNNETIDEHGETME